MKKTEIAERQRLALDYFNKAHIILTEEEKANMEVAETAAAEDWFFADVGEVDEVYAIPSAYSVYREYCLA